MPETTSKAPSPEEYIASLDTALLQHTRSLDPRLFDGAPMAEATITPLQGGHHSVNRLVQAGER